LTFDNLDDTAALVFSEYNIPSKPAWAFINQDGTVDTRMGVIRQDELEEILANL
jgi:hypothetical protein